MKRSLIIQAMLLTCASLGAQAAGLAGDWPNKPVRLVVAFPPGGGSDLVARSLG